MSNEFFAHSTYPVTGAQGSSAAMRATLANIEAGFDKMPALSGNGSKMLSVNSAGTALIATRVTVTNPATAATLTLADNSTLITSGAYSATMRFSAATDITFPTTGTLATTVGIPALVLATPLTGLSTASTADVVATDTVLAAFGQNQAKWNRLSGSAGADEVGFIYDSADAVAQTLQDSGRQIIVPAGFAGANDTVKVQKAIEYMVANDAALVFDRDYSIADTLTCTGKWNMRGRGFQAGMTFTQTDRAMLNFDIDTTQMIGCYLADMALVGPGSTDPASTAIRFTGDDVALIQYSSFKDLYVANFYSAVKDEKLARSTIFGLSGALNWNAWSGCHFVGQQQYNFWLTQGTGTGNTFDDLRVKTVNADSSHFFVDGAGCVVGDVILGTIHAACTDTVTGSNFLEIGASTEYRAQWDLSKVQFDANCNYPVKMSSTGSAEYVNWNIGSNNYGGLSDLGQKLQPLSQSVVVDRDTFEWRAGVHYDTDSTGLQALDCFEIEFSSFGSTIIKVSASAVIGGVQATDSEYEFQVRADASNAIGTELSHTLGTTGQLTWAYTDLGSKTGKFTLSFTPSSTGSRIAANIYTGSGRLLKITRSIVS
jgi:hypothetical protein